MGSSLSSGTTLSNSGTLTSANGLYRAIIQYDGNFVIYRGNIPVWSAQVAQGIGPWKLTLQPNGNLVITDSTHAITFSSNTILKGTAPWQLVMQINGELILYDANMNPIWSAP